ncbi:MAG: efflux RND transporter periplasmic adaptor subunit, partial [Minicystis sp.]
MTNPTLPTSAPAASMPSSARIRKAPIYAALGLLGAALAGGLLWKATHGGPPPSTIPAPDVPHVEGRAIVFSKSFFERAGVKLTTVKHAPLTPIIKVSGTVTYDPEYVAAIGTRIQGLVRKLVRLEGDAVKEGDLLAEIESAELGEAQASVSMVE